MGQQNAGPPGPKLFVPPAARGPSPSALGRIVASQRVFCPQGLRPFAGAAPAQPPQVAPPCGSGGGLQGGRNPEVGPPGGELQGGRKVVSSAGRGEEAKGSGRKPHGQNLRRDAKNPPMAAKPRAVPMEDPNNFGPDLPAPIIGMPHTPLLPGAPCHKGGKEGPGALSAALLPGAPRATRGRGGPGAPCCCPFARGPGRQRGGSRGPPAAAPPARPRASPTCLHGDSLVVS